MEQTFIEDMPDVCTIEIPELTASEIREIRIPKSEVTGKTKRELQRTRINDKENFWEDPEEPETRVCIEDFLVVSSKDSRNVVAFKSCFNEWLSRENCSPARYVVMRSRLSGDCSLPTAVDFMCDCQLAAKTALTANLYRVLLWAIETRFEKWTAVPLSVRRTIEERVGAELLRRKIFNGVNTYEYFNVGMKQRGRPRTQRTLRAA